MAEIRPLKGYRFRLAAPGDLARHAAPPYDMLDETMIGELYGLDAHNAVRIIQNRPQAGDSANKDRHERAAQLLQSWIRDGILTRDEPEGFYVYRQQFSVDMGAGPQTYVRTGLTARVRLVDFSEGIVLPHENTLSGPKLDRYELLEASRCNTGQIFGLVPDDGTLYEAICALARGEPLGFFDDTNGVRHELYRCSDRGSIEKPRKLMADRTILIADGHHRYETALNYFRTTGDPAAAYLMMTLVSMADPGLVIRPFHRLVRTGPLTARLETAQSLAPFFDLTDCGEATIGHVHDFLEGRTPFEMLFVDSTTRHSYGLATGRGGTEFLAHNTAGMSPRWNGLSVSKINRLVVEALMQQTLDGTVLHDVFDYVNDARAGFERSLSASAYRGGFFIRPLDINTVKDIVAAGERMPQKSTNFYPKLYSGLVFNMLEPQ